jgi:hypothetical protein
MTSSSRVESPVRTVSGRIAASAGTFMTVMDTWYGREALLGVVTAYLIILTRRVPRSRLSGRGLPQYPGDTRR